MKTMHRLRAISLSVFIFLVFIFVWQSFLEASKWAAPEIDPAYAALIGGAAKGGASIPGPLEVGTRIWEHLSDPFYDAGPNDKGVGIQIAYSLARVAFGFGIALLIAIPVGVLIGMSPLLYDALDPFIQVMKPISPLAWMPLALYTIKDSTISAVFVIFICSIWPMLINTAFGVATVRKDWIDVAKTLQVSKKRMALEVILPAAAPTIVTGMRISMGVAWLVIVAAEMLVGGTGIGYFVWNEWNNLSLTNVICAILFIGIVGMLLDQLLGIAAGLVAYEDQKAQTGQATGVTKDANGACFKGMTNDFATNHQSRRSGTAFSDA